MSLPLADISGQLKMVTTPERTIARLLAGRSSPVIFDIGACEGEDSIRYARRFPRGRVFSFEPLPDNQQLVTANLARYQVKNAELVPLALSDRAGPATFHVSGGEPKEKFSGEQWNYGNKSSSLLPPGSSEPMYGWVNFPKQITVTCETLDAFCTQRTITAIDFIHMDVQGAEFLVLSGASRMLAQIGALWLEVSNVELYRGQKLRGEIEAFLTQRGFVLTLEESRGSEGDQFYVNRGWLRGRAYLAGRTLVRQARKILGR
jgi:FkbM family methyltransferase